MTAKIGDIGTLRELDVKPGDVVRNMLSNCDYIIGTQDGTLFVFRIDGSPSMAVNESVDEYKLISRATQAPKLWRDMTPEEKGALLLAVHEGRVIEGCIKGSWEKLSDPKFNNPSLAYRVKPEPKRETYALKFEINGHTLFGSIDLIDGAPDCDSVKMEAI